MKFAQEAQHFPSYWVTRRSPARSAARVLVGNADAWRRDWDMPFGHRLRRGILRFARPRCEDDVGVGRTLLDARLSAS